MKELANFGQLGNRCAKARDILQKFNVIKERRPKPFGCHRIINANVVENGR